MKHSILVCDDDTEIRKAIRIYLEQENYDVIEAKDGCEAIDITRDNNIDLIILDVMMPKKNGLEAAAEIRELTKAPILFLSAKTEDTDKIIGLTMGGDDYITKPFNPIELIARVKAHLRRYNNYSNNSSNTSVYLNGPIKLDDEKKEVYISNELVDLTAVEFKILHLLLSSPGQVFSSNQIYEKIWNDDAYDVGKVIAVHVRHIRKKIEINPNEPEILKVIYGLGYKVVNFNEK